MLCNPAKPSTGANVTRLFITVISVILLTACGSGETNVDRGNRAGILYWGNGEEPQDLDPHITTGVSESYIQESLFEPLVNSHPETLEPEPGVAQRWDINDDKTTYTFHLNPNARWSNGEPVTAEDFRWTFWRAMHPKLGNQYNYMYYPIKNAGPYLRGDINDFDKVGIKVIDKQTLQIQLENPTPYFLGLLSHHSYYPVPRSAIEAHGNAWTRGSHWTRPGNMVSNGAFRLTQWKLFNYIEVEKNPYYHKADQVALNGIRFLPTENITTEERMFRANQLHHTYELPADKTSYYRENAPEQLLNQPYLGTYYYRLNTRIKPLDNPKVRRALALAINRQQIVERITKQGQLPAFTITPPNTAGYTAESSLRYDPEEARRLLAEAGYPSGEGIDTLEVLYNTKESHRKIAVAIQQMWKQELNINITLRNEDWKVYLDSEKRGEYQVSRASWIGDYLDPNTFLDLWIKDGGNNRTGWHNPEYDRLVLEQAPRASSREQRYALLMQAEKILLDEVPVIPIYTYATRHLVHPSLKGVTPNLLDRPFFSHFSLEDTQTQRPNESN
ncbi:peptide ABC transporter substrate-binding protein [bacterium SCSIO 12696]|nr:peptide ABC transporter substrate-binding protein [bacterium SCSIO 12696]